MKKTPKVRRDKEKVIDEVWTEARIREFLDTITPSQSGATFPGDHDFYVLLRAYQAMRLEDFEKFLTFFKERGGNLNAKNGRDQTLSMFISSHRKAQPYLSALTSISD